MNIFGLFFCEKDNPNIFYTQLSQSYKEINNKLHIYNGYLIPKKYIDSFYEIPFNNLTHKYNIKVRLSIFEQPYINAVI